MIFIDMDGVLCGFAEEALRLHGRGDLINTYPAGVWDLASVLRISDEEFWAPINEAGSDWWATLPKYPTADDLVNAVLRSRADWAIATAPSLSSTSIEGKLLWLHYHYGIEPSHCVFTQQKHLLSQPGRLLIDDNDGNCDRWTAHGGEAILWPQPWNAKAHRSYIEYEAIIKAVREYKDNPATP